MEWIPVAFVTFKVLLFGTGMFFAVKWHYDRARKDRQKQNEMRAILRAGGKAAAVFVFLLLGLGYATFAFLRMLGNDMTLP